MAIGFGEWVELSPDHWVMVLYLGKELRLFNNDETKLPLSGVERVQSGHNVLVLYDPKLPRPGRPQTKVCLNLLPFPI